MSHLTGDQLEEAIRLAGVQLEGGCTIDDLRVFVEILDLIRHRDNDGQRLTESSVSTMEQMAVLNEVLDLRADHTKLLRRIEQLELWKDDTT